jgi:Protein of unknown function (DUF1579)
MTSETTQQSPMVAEPREEHKWLQKLVGEWTYESEMTMEPDQPPQTGTGAESVRALGELWVLLEGRGDLSGGDISIITLGYDPEKNRFVGTFIGSTMTYLWLYDGELDAAGKVLTLYAEGPSMLGDGTTAKYQDVIEIVSDDHRVFRSRVLGDDGKWQEFMTADYRRKR